MIDLLYRLVIEATAEPDYFGFYSPDLEGFSGIGLSVQGCISKARRGMIVHAQLLEEMGLPVPPRAANPQIVIQDDPRFARAS